MKRTKQILVMVFGLVFSAAGVLHASDCAIPNTFSAGTPAVAAEVNANFEAVETAVDDNDTRIAAMESALAALQNTVTSQAEIISALTARLESMEGNAALDLGDFVTVDTESDDRGPLVTFAGVNLQIVNGLGSTETQNGLGNLIIGYDEVQSTGSEYCSDGISSDAESCKDAGGTWARSHKTGSHYLVLGSENNYMRYAGIVAGNSSAAFSIYGSVMGGIDNSVYGDYGIVIGGGFNSASGLYSIVSGGNNNDADGLFSGVSGGVGNRATGNNSSVSGGSGNESIGAGSSVGGGRERSADGSSDWVAGELFQDD